MAVESKHLATFLLGAAAALGAYKYSQLNDDQKKQLADKVKAKANELKGEAEQASEKAKEYFNELKTKGSEALKEHFPGVEKMMHDLFHPAATSSEEQTAEVTPTV